MLVLVMLLVAAPRAQAATNLQEVHAQRDDGKVRVMLQLDGPAPQPSAFATDTPPRIAVDLPGTGLAMARPFQQLDVGVLRGIAAVAAGGRTRLVLDLRAPVPYTLARQGDHIIVTLDSASADGVPVSSEVAAAPRYRVTGVDFHRGDDGGGRVEVHLSGTGAVADVHQRGGKVVALFRHTAVPARLRKRLDVTDFATPVQYVDVAQDGADTKITLTPINGDFEQLAYQSDDRFVIDLQPLTPARAAEREQKPHYTGQHITLNFQNIDVRSLLQIIADVAGTNMVVSDSVKGDIAIRLKDVPWDQALAIILRTKGLGMRRQGNVIFVAPLQEMAAREKVELEAQRQKSALEPLHSELIQINYAKAADIAALLKSGNNSLLSARGRVTVDERTNTLLVLDTLDRLADIRHLVERLDVPVRQVLIESRIVIANDNFDRQIGSQFGITGVGSIGGKGLFATTGTGSGTNQMLQSFLGSGFPVAPPTGSTGTTGGTTTGAPTSRYNVNLPVANPNGSLALTLLSGNFLVDLELSALQNEGRGEVVSSPRIITANAKEASIEQGVEIPYQQSTSSGATSVAFKKAVLALHVTPQITPDNRIIMDLAISKDSVGENVPTGLGGSVPSIDTRKINTQVLVNNGQTVVLGGIYEQTRQTTRNKVPLLGDIPLLGWLFRFSEDQNNRTELLVFITPKILGQNLQVDQ
jgi:type IV pilus secretin (or competence protein) PilQ